MTMKGKNEKVTTAQQNFERLNDALEQSVDFHQEVDRIISSTISPVEGIFDRASTGIPTLTNQLDYSWGDVNDLEEGGGGSLGSIQYKHRSSLTNSAGTLPISNQQQHAGRGIEVEGGGVGKKKRILQPGEVEMQGYRRRQLTTMLVYIAYFLSVGIVYILQRWMPMVFFRFQHRRVGLTLASKVVVKSSDNKKEVCPVSLCEDNVTPMIFYRFLPYVYSHEKMTFEPLHFDINIPYHELHNRYQQGLDPKLHPEQRRLFGDNLIRVPVPSVGQLLLDEVLHPFYIFQILSVVLWAIELYLVYAVCIVVIASIGVVFNLVETRRNVKKLNSMASFQCPVKVKRRQSSSISHEYQDFDEVSSQELVPGDLILLDSVPFTVPCDILLLSGQCVVNESMLTGESVPVVKTMLPTVGEGNEPFNDDSDAKYVLFCGTQVIQTRGLKEGMVLGLVYRTGFATAKGKLVTSILYPRPAKFKFYSDAFKFVGVLALLCVPSMIYSGFVLRQFGKEMGETVILVLDLFTTAVPPALPVATTVGTAFAISRLKRKKIFCIAPSRVNVCGTITSICFDKTGTLTEDGLDVYGVHPSHEGIFLDLFPDVSAMKLPFSSLLDAMGCCHGLAEMDGNLIGDPLEVKMFQATKWTLYEPGAGVCRVSGGQGEEEENIIATIVRQPPEQTPTRVGRELEILRRFDFSSKKQRMSVLARQRHTANLVVYVKGAPEVLVELCHSDSIPDNFNQVLNSYTRKGYRVLACASAYLPHMVVEEALKIPRAEIETNLTFSGFLIMQNKLKGDTTAAIKVITTAGVRPIMVTGDNALTAISVARECTLINPELDAYLGDVVTNDRGDPFVKWTLVRQSDNPISSSSSEQGGYDLPDTISSVGELLLQQSESGIQPTEIAVTGRAFALLENHPLFSQLLIRANIFARMSPDQKTKLVETLAELGYRVAMCGDGANDCGALKAADVGLSLSEAEASIAAPFTSSSPTIASMITLLREGKAALATSIQCFKFMAMYSIIESSTVVMLYSRGTVLSDLQYLYIDLITIMPIAFLMARTEATRVLGQQKPPSRLVSSSVMVSLLGQIIIQIAFQVLVLMLILDGLPWFNELEAGGIDQQGVIDHLLFGFANFQYLSVAVAYSISRPFRRPIWTNPWYMLSLILLTASGLYLLLGPWDSFILSLFELSSLIPFGSKLLVLGAAGVDLLVTYLYEKIVVVWLLTNRSWSFTTNRPLYKVLLEEGPTSTSPNSTEMVEMSSSSPSPSRRRRLFDGNNNSAP